MIIHRSVSVSVCLLYSYRVSASLSLPRSARVALVFDGMATFVCKLARRDVSTNRTRAFFVRLSYRVRRVIVGSVSGRGFKFVAFQLLFLASRVTNNETNVRRVRRGAIWFPFERLANVLEEIECALTAATSAAERFNHLIYLLIESVFSQRHTKIGGA